jgi:hypothetical protein
LAKKNKRKGKFIISQYEIEINTESFNLIRYF